MRARPDHVPPAEHPTGSAESIGGLLARARATRGLSQLRLAELLCTAAGLPTVTRHEVSRWERGARVPSRHWLRWLALVLELPGDELESAAELARARRHRPSTGADGRGGAGPGRPAGQPAHLAHVWLAAPGDLARDPGPGYAGGRRRRRGRCGDCVDALAGRVRELRRMDDLVGGADLADTVERELREVLVLVAGRRPGRRLLGLVAELAQLAGWTAGDAGRIGAAVHLYRTALATAEAAGDRLLGAHVLGCLSHLVAPHDPHQALLVARSAYAGIPPDAPVPARALLAHRVAFAAALAGDRRASERALADAERLTDRWTADGWTAGRGPDWLYWLDETELAALAGRCFAVLRRPLRAEPLLRRRMDGPDAVGPRTAALDGAWLAQAYLDAGEVEQARATAGRALLAAVRSGSARAATLALSAAGRAARAGPDRAGPSGRRYAKLLAASRPYLPGPPADGCDGAGWAMARVGG